MTFGSSIALWAIETHNNIPSAFRGLRILPTGTFPCAVTALQELRQYHHHLLSINPPASEIVYYFFFPELFTSAPYFHVLAHNCQRINLSLFSFLSVAANPCAHCKFLHF